jgi:microcin C transport system permease protein
MTNYLIRRLLLMIPTFIGITMLVFTLTRFTPGGPVERILMQQRSAQVDGGGRGLGSVGGADMQRDASQPLSEDQLDFLRKFYGLDKPVLVAYWEWLGKVVRLDLGESTRYWDPVIELIVARLPVSMYYGLMTFLLTYGISVPLGVWKALKHHSLFDNVTSILVFVGYALPSFVVGIGLLMFFAYQLEWFPFGGFTSDNFSDLDQIMKARDILTHSVLPLTAWVLGTFAGLTLLMKNTLMENLAADYVRTVMAQGITYKRAVFKHAIRNSIVPIAAGFGHIISRILAGSFLLEVVFNIDGMGLLSYESVVERDYPVVMGVLVVSSVLLLLGNLLSDICVAIVDPRVKFT